VNLDRQRASRTNRLLDEVCAKYGWCDVVMIPGAAENFHQLVTAGADAYQLADAILKAEGATAARPHRRQLRRLIEDWLLDPPGPGADSGLPLL
jgi:hypothetical protein